MKKPAIEIVSGDNLRTLRDERGSIFETIPAAEQQVLDKIDAEIDDYSITPTTFNERIFEENIDNTWFTDKNSFHDTEVLRFGINTASMYLVPSIDQDGIQQVDETSRAASTVKSTGYKPEDAAALQLASLEQTLLNKAISWLIESNMPTVVVDIFARINGGVSNGAIKIKHGVPEIHTIVLYKNPPVSMVDTSKTTSESTEATTSTSFTRTEWQILIIDPSNFLFSSHLSNFNIQREQHTANSPVSEVNLAEVNSREHDLPKSSALTNWTIKTIHKSTQIYKPDSNNIGSQPNQYRDCIDLAVKISLSFNASQESFSFQDIKDVLACSHIHNISNMKVIDQYFTIGNSLPIRSKQSSDIDIIKKYNQIEKLISINHELILNIFSEEVVVLLKKECMQILKNSSPTVLYALCDHNSKCLDQIGNFYEQLRDEHVKYAGELAQLHGEGEI